MEPDGIGMKSVVYFDRQLTIADTTKRRYELIALQKLTDVAQFHQYVDDAFQTDTGTIWYLLPPASYQRSHP